MKKAQLQELLTQYGPIAFCWMDNAVGDGGLSHRETVDFVYQFQPHAFVGLNTGETAGRLNLRERRRDVSARFVKVSLHNNDNIKAPLHLKKLHIYSREE